MSDILQPIAPPRSVVAVSGGQDSLLALALVTEEAARTPGAAPPLAVHARLLPPEPAHEPRHQARVAALQDQCRLLGVPLLELDLHREFRALVIRPFLQAYVEGLTPNPCALCNPRVKFGLLRDAALRHPEVRPSGATEPRFVTGHYARIVRHPQWGGMLGRAVDPTKDQSYFLALLPKELLPGLHFPLAEVHKREVPALLAARGLTPPDARESQEVCFIPDNDYRRFLQEETPNHGLRLSGPGPVLLPDGKRLGTHQGLWRYTQGQRRGLNLPYHEPLYVLAKDPGRNALVVGTAAQRRSPGCVVQGLNCFAPQEQWPAELLVQIRYRQAPRPAVPLPHPAGLALRFLDPEAEGRDGPPAPGQLAVCSTPDGLILAGGSIASALGEA